MIIRFRFPLGDPPPALSEPYHPRGRRAPIEPDHSNLIAQRRYPLCGPSHSLAPSTENASSGTWKHCSLRLLGPRLVHPLNRNQLLPCRLGPLRLVSCCLFGSSSGTYGFLFLSAIPCFVPWNGGRRTNLRTSTDGLRATPPDCGRNDNRFPVPPRWH